VPPLAGLDRRWGLVSQGLEAVKKSTGHVILSPPWFSAGEGSPQLLLGLSRLRRTAGMLRSAQHDSFRFFHTFLRPGLSSIARQAGSPSTLTPRKVAQLSASALARAGLDLTINELQVRQRLPIGASRIALIQKSLVL